MHLNRSSPRDGGSFLIRLSSQLNNPDGIPRLSCLDGKLVLSIDSVGHILINTNPSTGDRGIPPSILVRLWVKLLVAFIKHLVRGQCPL